MAYNVFFWTFIHSYLKSTDNHYCGLLLATVTLALTAALAFTTFVARAGAARHLVNEVLHFVVDSN